jgi:hypothetical protein
MRLGLIALLLFTPASYAAEPAAESVKVAQLLLNNPDVTGALYRENITTLVDIASTPVSPGVTRYDLKFERRCECLGGSAHVVITEDLTPTHLDGLAEYTHEIHFDGSWSGSSPWDIMGD